MNSVLTEHQRRLANLIRIGTVHEANYATGRVRVKFGEIITAWLPMGGQRAGGMRVWNPLTVGEQVVVFSPSGDLAQGVAFPGLYSNANAAPGETGTAFNIVFPDGSTLSWDGGNLNFETTAAVKIKAPSIELEATAITVKGPVTQTGGDITSDGISVQHHVHGGVESGGAETLEPQ